LPVQKSISQHRWSFSSCNQRN